MLMREDCSHHGATSGSNHIDLEAIAVARRQIGEAAVGLCASDCHRLKLYPGRRRLAPSLDHGHHAGVRDPHARNRIEQGDYF
jgi:hypothetical protein